MVSPFRPLMIPSTFADCAAAVELKNTVKPSVRAATSGILCELLKLVINHLLHSRSRKFGAFASKLLETSCCRPARSKGDLKICMENGSATTQVQRGWQKLPQRFDLRHQLRVLFFKLVVLLDQPVQLANQVRRIFCYVCCVICHCSR